jgi:hypothetical protein
MQKLKKKKEQEQEEEGNSDIQLLCPNTLSVM